MRPAADAATQGTIATVSDQRRLYLLRHAKSSWDDPSQPDHDRTLSERGRRAVKLLARHLAERRIEPELVLCSSARRTRETLEGLRLRSTTVIEHRLYGAGADDLLERLRGVDPQLRSVMLVGHNPALQMLVLRLAAGELPGRPAGAEGLAEIANKLPTGALVTLRLESPWAQLGPRGALLEDYVRPKALQFPAAG